MVDDDFLREHKAHSPADNLLVWKLSGKQSARFAGSFLLLQAVSFWVVRGHVKEKL